MNLKFELYKWASLVKNPPAIQETLVFWVRKIPGEGIDYPLQRSWASLVVAQTVKNLPALGETWVPSLRWEAPLEEGMAAHSSLLAWRSPHGQKSLVGCSPWGPKEADMIE